MSPTPARAIHLKSLDDQAAEHARLCELLAGYCADAGLALDDDQVAACIDHLLYVIQVNEYINLTRITDVDEAVVLHILDSLLLAPYIKEGSAAMVDMGTGAGFPGIPLAVMTGIQATLLDSVNKKVLAVNAFARALGLEGRVRGEHDRLETFGAAHGEEYDLVVARALAPLPVLLEYASPLLKRGGQCLLAKANPEDEELAQGSRAAAICGFELMNIHEFDLPGGLGHRTVFDYRKVKRPTIKLPRPAGQAKRHPLGTN
ncbi:16S rRNA (guanine(527)-N(7))-methyltransferase RsmG [Collinsella tanakaei]|uniref:16S rRNA (guanine(527)-N(7))-methyltransferase RsmG n=1 Tax=Collinsella tanakaei TaxID=626935 RepID=UPI0025A32247|nr:16S rRNA (guanine(527)-N(7))-methyltransferase RsmG [Collinsella tanakaei]MDM8246155.1 16S rRNA (guanine(527)-N(7))-methyltransferase RsmG [Collinsella tanakaei]